MDITVLSTLFQLSELLLMSIPVVGIVFSRTLISVPLQATGPIDDPKLIPASPLAIGKGLFGILTNMVKPPVKIIQPVLPDKGAQGQWRAALLFVLHALRGFRVTLTVIFLPADSLAILEYINTFFSAVIKIGYTRPVFFTVFIALFFPQVSVPVIDSAYPLPHIIPVIVLSLQRRIGKIAFADTFPLIVHISELGKQRPGWIIALTDAFPQPVFVIILIGQGPAFRIFLPHALFLAVLKNPLGLQLPVLMEFFIRDSLLSRFPGTSQNKKKKYQYPCHSNRYSGYGHAAPFPNKW
jgi:hypothetical protein